MRLLYIQTVLFCLCFAKAFSDPNEATPFFQWIEDNSEYSKLASTYPAFENWIFKQFSWHPAVDLPRTSAACDPSRPRLQNSTLNDYFVKDYAHQNENFYKMCRTELVINSNSAMLHNIKSLSFDDFEGLQNFKRVLFRWENNSTLLKGRLALKSDNAKHPLVILRMGIFGNSEDVRAEKFIMQILSQNTPYHVLVIENTTGVDFISHNNFLSAGGFEESFQTISIARRILDGELPFSKQVSKIFLTGVSLGGHGVLHALHLNEQLQKPVIEKALVLCPLLDFKAATDRLSERTLKTTLMDYWLQKRLRFLESKEPNLFRFDLSLFHETIFSRFIHRIQEQFTGVHAKDPKLNWKNNELMTKEIGEKDFSTAQNILHKYKNIKTPLLVLRTATDHLVDFDDNTKALESLLNPSEENNIGSILFQEGHHCSLPVAYRWDYLQRLFLDYLRD